MELIASSNTIPGAGPSTTMMEMALSGGAAGSVRHTTVRTSAPLRSHPVAEEIHFFRPLMTQFSPTRFAVVRTPSPGGGDAPLAPPPPSPEPKPPHARPPFFPNPPH